MYNSAYYVYGIVKFGTDLGWNGIGLNKRKVYLVNQGKFCTMVHDCKEKPYVPKNPKKIKELILAHNKVLDKAMERFGGVIPLSFNTIIKRGKNSSYLKKWINEDKKRLEKIWNKIKGKEEYGIRIYYTKDKLIQKASNNSEVKEIEKSKQGKGKGLNYLLQGKVKSKINEIIQEKINHSKQKFYTNIKKITKDLKINIPKISINEKKDLLLSLSILVNKQQINQIKNILKKVINKDFSFQLIGPFAPYSFVENETK